MYIYPRYIDFFAWLRYPGAMTIAKCPAAPPAQEGALNVGAGGPRYRIEWWTPLPEGEWAGRWDVYDDGSLARSVALSLLASEDKPELLLLAALGEDGRESARAVVDAADVEAWNPLADPLPLTDRDPFTLPPRGRDDVGTETLGTCRDALLAAVGAGLMAEEHVAPLVETIQQAFVGVGPGEYNGCA